MTMIVGQYVVASLLLVGAITMLIASIGIIRMPDFFLRMSGASKAATLGVGSMALAAILYFGEAGVTARAVAIVVFALLTTPIASHMMGRAAYNAGTPLWESTAVDEMKGRVAKQ